ncbi:Predicted phosphoesterase [Sphingobacterium nematocida]|uniref:Predicted phosphoesterase n=1 Tax=Sphingobacterium nematocida TaxID=1513896 RepID=A0A1T5GJ85_9SPHI|nr:metallophosphoesterase [Sphingobacterium nematocida]SKC08397.1 Predicted phosphoesterase [Sphingobacterium nematocida]
MRIQIISDLHQEFGRSELEFDKADLLILAGDTNIGTKGIEWVKNSVKDIPVIYILGNHEYYKGSYPKTLNKIKDASKGTNIVVLENDRFDFNGIRFHGATLWTDFSLFGDPVKYGIMCQGKMNDYRMIRRDPSYSKMRSIDTFRLHQFSRLWLEDSLEESTSFRNIVVTHHAPSLKSIPTEFKNDYLSAAYASDMEEMITRFQPEYWIHGHIHTPIKYEIGATKIICNPHGYIDEKYNGYEKELIIEL